MANIKKVLLGYTESGITVYCMVRRDADSYRLDDADGNFTASPADPYLSLTEDSVIKGLYEVSESRQVWSNGIYLITSYKQAAGSPVPANDSVIGQGEFYIVSDTEVVEELYLENIKARTDENAFQDGSIWIDVTYGSSGTTYPIGTTLNPVNNFSDALTIANANNLHVFKIEGAITVGGSDDISNMIFHEVGAHAQITLTDGCTTLNTVFKGHIHIVGYFSGHVHCHEIHFLSGTYNMEGFFDYCLFDDGNYSTNSSLTRLINCISSGQQGQSVVLSTPGSGVDLGIWGWSGKMEIEDKNGTETFDIEMLTGELEVSSSCTGGQIRVRGVCEVTNNTGGTSVNTGKLITEQIDAQLSLTHGSGLWDIATVIAHLLDIKGSGWVDENIRSIDIVVDAIKAVTDNLPDSGALTTISNNILQVKKINEGRWKMINNQFIIYDDDDVTPLLTFDMKNALGIGVMTDPVERTPV